MTWQGFSGQLQTPRDLVGKLRRDLQRLRRNPRDADAAFDYFVTADSLVDWLWPGATGKQQREAARSSDPMKTVYHLASGAKHFRAEHKGHTSVSDVTERRGVFQAGAFDPGAFDVGGLVIDLSNGTESDVYKFAKEVQAWAEAAVT